LLSSIARLRSLVCHYTQSKPTGLQLNYIVTVYPTHIFTNNIQTATPRANRNGYANHTVLERNANTNTNATVTAAAAAAAAAQDSRTSNNKRGLFSVSRVMTCVISVVVGVPAYVALPLDVREVIRMVVDGITWVATVLPL